MDISFQNATADDIPAIQRLSEAIWHAWYPGIISTDQIEYMLERMYAADVIRSEMEHQWFRYVLVSQKGRPIGYLSFRHDPPAADVLLSKIYLLPSHHGRGIGRQMLEHVMNEARTLGARSIHLFVNRKNTRAIQAYERAGFIRTGSVVTDIGGGFVMDDHRMELRL